MPPPPFQKSFALAPTTLPVTTQRSRLTVPLLRMPPARSKPKPLVIVRWRSVAVEPPSTMNTRSAPPPFSVRPGAAAASIVTDLPLTMKGLPGATVIVWPASAAREVDRAAAADDLDRATQRPRPALIRVGHRERERLNQPDLVQQETAARETARAAARGRSPTRCDNVSPSLGAPFGCQSLRVKPGNGSETSFHPGVSSTKVVSNRSAVSGP